MHPRRIGGRWDDIADGQQRRAKARPTSPSLTAQVLSLQGLAGNRAVADLLSARAAPVQRSGGGCAGPGRCSCESCGSDEAAASVQRAPDPAEAGCALTTYSGSNFVGKTVTADEQFVGSLESVNSYAAANDVNIHVTSSFRTSTTVPGAIVTPATASNHLAGHAIDMNVKHGADKSSWCNSACLRGTLPAGVKGFIDAVKADSSLRWGGTFGKKDPVHIDDGLNVNDGESYKARRKATQQARKSGCG